MKRTFRNLCFAMGAFAMAAVGMTSCEPKPGPDEDSTEWGKFGEPDAVWMKEDDGNNVFMLAIPTEGLYETGEGTLIQIQLFSQSENEPKNGEYTVLTGNKSEDMTFCPGGLTQDGGIGGTAVLYVEGGEATDYEMVEDGTISVKKNDEGEWEIKASFPGIEYDEVNFKGKLTFEDVTPQPDYSQETKEAPAGEYTLNSGLAVAAAPGLWLVEVTSDGTPFELATFYLFSDATTMDGLKGKTFKVDGSGDLNTAAASSGYYDGNHTPSLIYIECVPAEEQGYLTPGGVYYLVSGSVSIDANGMLSFDCKSAGGHTVKGKVTAALKQGSLPGGVSPHAKVMRPVPSVKRMMAR